MPEPATLTTRETMTPEEAARRVSMARGAVVGEVQKVIVGHDDLIEFLLIALFSRGHLLIGGSPGSARSELLSALAKVVHLKFRHLTMSADATEIDVTGQEKGEAGSDAARRIVKGPIFSELLLASEINQASRRAQAALFHGLRYGRAVISGMTYELDEPRLVCATYDENSPSAVSPLMAQQLNHFMFSFDVGYPTEQQEREIVARRTAKPSPDVRVVLRPRDIAWIRQLVQQMPVVDQTVNYAVDLVRATRPDYEGVPKFVRSWVDFGAGPQASELLVVAAKARALLKGRTLVHSADVRAVARQVLRHRIFLNKDAEQRGITADQVVDKIVAVVKERWTGMPVQPANLVVVSDPVQQTPSVAQPTNAVAQSALPNRPFMTPQPPPTSAWPMPPAGEHESATSTASQWPPGQAPTEDQSAARRNP